MQNFIKEFTTPEAEKKVANRGYWGYQEMTEAETRKVAGAGCGGCGGGCGGDAGGDAGGDSSAGSSSGADSANTDSTSPDTSTAESSPPSDSTAVNVDSTPTLSEVTVTATAISDDQALGLANALGGITGGALGAMLGAAENYSNGNISPPANPPIYGEGGGLANPGTGNPMGDPGPAYGGL